MPVWMLLLLTMPALGVPTEGPIAYWKMDAVAEGVVADASGHGHDARLGGKAPEAVPGVIGGALRFRGEDEAFFEVARPEGLTPPSGLTAMAWVKPAARNKTCEILCGKGDRSGNPPWPGWRLRVFWGRAQFEYGTAEGKEVRVDSPQWSVPEGFWTHVAASFDGKSVRVYVNGVEAASAPAEGPILPARQLVIGNYLGRKNAYPFDGLLDDVKILDRALSADEVFTEAVRGME